MAVVDFVVRDYVATITINRPEARNAMSPEVMVRLDDAWRVFGRTYIAHVLDEEGQEELRRVLERRMPHTMYLPLRFLRTRRPG